MDVIWLIVLLMFCVAIVAPALLWICVIVLALLWYNGPTSDSDQAAESFFSPWTETDSPRDPSEATIRTRTCDNNCVPYGQPDPSLTTSGTLRPSCDVPQIVCDGPRSTSDVDNKFMYPDTLAYMMTNGIPMEKRHGCNMQMVGAAVPGTRMGAPTVGMPEDDPVPLMQPGCVRKGDPRAEGMTCCEEDLRSSTGIIADVPGLNLPTAESGRRWPDPPQQSCQPWAPGIGDAYRTPGCARTPYPTEANTYPERVGQYTPGMDGNRSENFMGREIRDPSGEQSWPPGYYAGCPQNKDDPFYKMDQPYKEFERNTDMGTCYAPVSVDYSCEAQRYLDIDAKNAQISKLRGGQRSRKCSDGWASKNANFFRKNFAREIDEYEQKPWWGRQEV